MLVLSKGTQQEGQLHSWGLWPNSVFGIYTKDVGPMAHARIFFGYAFNEVLNENCTKYRNSDKLTFSKFDLLKIEDTEIQFKDFQCKSLSAQLFYFKLRRDLETIEKKK